MNLTTKQDKNRLVAVVVTHNRLAQLRVTLARLLQSPPADLAGIVVVDNASTDGTEAFLAEQADPRIDVEISRTNLGGAGGFEAGMRRAVADFDPDWIVVMDDDARPEEGAISAFHQLDKGPWEALAAAVYFPDGDICEMNCPSRNPFWHGREFLRTLAMGRAGFHLPPRAYCIENGAAPVDVASFVGLFLSRRAVELAGYPDPGLFLYGDDALYTLGLSAKGGRIGFEPKVRFEHDCATFVDRRRRFRPLWRAYYYHRNLLLLYRIAAGRLFWPALLVVVPKWLWKARGHAGERRIFLRLMRHALRDGIMRRTQVSHAQVCQWADGDKPPGI